MKNYFRRGMAIGLLSFSLLSLIGCGGEKVENILSLSEVNLETLKEYKDSLVGDNSAVVNIMKALPGNKYIDKVVLQTDKEPYGIEVYYSNQEADSVEEYLGFWENTENTLQKNSIVVFSLITNVDSIKFNVLGTKKQDFSYKKSDIQALFGVYMNKFLEDESAWSELKRLKIKMVD